MNNTNQPNGFATASMVLGILAFISVFTMTVFPPLILGGLSIILGLLSRGSERKPGGNALIGIIVSTCALIINLSLCVTSFYAVFSNPEMTKEYFHTISEAYEQMTGIPFDELLESYGIDPAILGE